MSTIKWFGPQVVAETKLIAGNRLIKAAFVVERSAKEKAPVNKIIGQGGRLRTSIGSEVKGLVASIGSNVNYAIYQELGTRKMAAQPYLRPALIGSLPTIRKIFG